MSDVRQLRSMAQRLCNVATGSEEEIRSALGVATEPPPLGAAYCDVSPGLLSRASVELQFKPPLFTRAHLDREFGVSEALPRTGPGAAHVLMWDVTCEGTPAKVAVFARFTESPTATSGPKSVLLRIDPV